MIKLPKPSLLLALFLCLSSTAHAQLKNLGTASAVSESRGVIAYQTASGDPIIITISMDRLDAKTRNSLLILDVKTGQTQQYWLPDPDDGSHENYSCMLASNGKFYTMFGDIFLEFDLDKRQWTYRHKIEGRAMSYAEDRNGVIYFANFPQSTLYSFNPQTRQFTSWGRLDDTQKYPFALVAADDGWIYAGIGTGKSSVVAFNLRSKERHQLLLASEQKLGEAVVFRATDGNIYATALKKQEKPLYQLNDGAATLVTKSTFPQAEKTGFVFWQDEHYDFPGGGRVVKFVLRNKQATIEDAQGNTRQLTFDYKSNGAGITSMTLGPDGAIWGCTSHPIRLWRFDPAKSTFTGWHGMNEINGGNFPNLVTVGNSIYGALYNGGKSWKFDIAAPWESGKNPFYLGKFPEIARPRVAIKTGDNKTVIFGGYPGYGKTGGDLVFVDTQTHKAAVVKVQAALPGLSTVAMRALPGGILVGGTSTAAPGGGQRLADKAVLYLMDTATQKVLFQTVPVASGADIVSLETKNGLVYGITADSQLFVFDPQRKKVLWKTSLKAYGSPLRAGQTLLRADDGTLYGVMNKAVFRVRQPFAIDKLIDLPKIATAGIAIKDNYLYFACDTEVWSYRLH